MPSKPQISTFRTSDGISLYYESFFTSAEAPSYIFLHGMGGSATGWEHLKNKLDFQEKNILFLDLRGHGLSDHPQKVSDYQMSLFAQDIWELMQELKLSKATLVGHCLGAKITIRFALQYPESTSKIVGIGAGYYPPFLPTTSFPIFHFLGSLVGMLAQVSPRQYIPGRTSGTKYAPRDWNFPRMIEDLAHTSIFVNLSLMKCIMTTEEDINMLRSIQPPVTMIHGKKDSIYPLWQARELNRMIPQSQLVELEDANHMLIVTHVDEILSLL